MFYKHSIKKLIPAFILAIILIGGLGLFLESDFFQKKLSFVNVALADEDGDDDGGGDELPPPSPPGDTACSDRIDNDSDGRIDMADPDCSSPSDDNEGTFVPAPPECSDHIDNDHDGRIDMADPDCSSPSDDDEGDYTSQCSDHRDNDYDGLTDMRDPGCSGSGDNSEYDPPSPPPSPACSDGIDNDDDGVIDMADPGCSAPGDNDENARPLIALLGDNPFVLTLDELFTDLGATASDFEDGDLTSQILRTGSVDNHTIGDYLLRYNAVDSNGFAAEEKVRAVLVRAACADGRDNDGDGLIDMDDSGCSDTNDNDESGEVLMPACSDGIDNDGDGKIDYPADDGCENESDNNENVKPEITLLGGSPVTATLNEQFVDLGATALDSEDGDITSQIVATGTVDVYATGTYFRYYDVIDSGGQAAEEKVRMVFVKTQCDDGKDNDGDGFIDLADLGCADGNDNSELLEEENSAPVWIGQNYASTTLGNSFDLTILATDPDNDVLTVTSTIPEGATYNPETGQFLWAPFEIGTSTVFFSASDGATSTGFSVLLEVFGTSTPDENLPPYFVNFNPSGNATATILYSYDVQAVDPENAMLVFSLETAPVGMTIASSTGLIEWTPSESQVSSTTYLVNVAVSDGVNTTSTSYSVLVNPKPVPPLPPPPSPPPIIIVPSGGGGGGNTNYPPRFRDFNPPIFATATELYSYDVKAYDPENDPITYSFNKVPQGMIISSSTGFISWYSILNQVSVIPYEVIVVISDGRGTASASFLVTVVTPAYKSPPFVIVPLVEAEELTPSVPGEVLGEAIATTTPPIAVAEEEKCPSFLVSLLTAIGKFGVWFPLYLFAVFVLLCIILYLVRKNRKLSETLAALEEKKESSPEYMDIPIMNPESSES